MAAIVGGVAVARTSIIIVGVIRDWATLKSCNGVKCQCEEACRNHLNPPSPNKSRVRAVVYSSYPKPLYQAPLNLFNLQVCFGDGVADNRCRPYTLLRASGASPK